MTIATSVAQWLHSNPESHLGVIRASIAYRIHANKYAWNPFSQVIDAWSVEETIEQVIKERMSVARFGDGDLHLMTGMDIDFQEAEPTLFSALKDVALNTSPTLAVCIPDVFTDLTWATRPASRYWKKHLLVRRQFWHRTFDKNRKYYNASISRPYIDWRDKERADGRFRTLAKLWEGRTVVIIEGVNSRLGVGNDLFSNVNSVSRILCPQVNAWSQHDKIIEAATSFPKDTLFLLSLGPTATALASELDTLHYQAVDIGQIDSEYEWFLRNATTRIMVSGKYFNEARGADLSLTCRLAEKYQDEIVATIGVQE